KAGALAERIRNSIEGTPVIIGRSRPAVPITVSIGIATLPGNITLPEDLVRLADKALYQAKETGRNKVCIYC
ncbi:MAG TPA: GGDEF domain-containing protein, partial [Nitrospirota bacterium]